MTTRLDYHNANLTPTGWNSKLMPTQSHRKVCDISLNWHNVEKVYISVKKSTYLEKKKQGKWQHTYQGTGSSRPQNEATWRARQSTATFQKNTCLNEIKRSDVFASVACHSSFPITSCFSCLANSYFSYSFKLHYQIIVCLKFKTPKYKLYFAQTKAIPIKSFVSHRPPSGEGRSVGQQKKRMNTWRVLSARQGRAAKYKSLVMWSFRS